MEIRNQQIFLPYGNIPQYVAELDVVVQRREICTIIGVSGSGKSALLRYWREKGSRLLMPTDVLIVPLVLPRDSYKSATHMLYARLLDALQAHAPPAYIPRRLFRRYDADHHGRKSAEALRKDAMGRLATSAVTAIVLDGTEHLDKAAFDAALGIRQYATRHFALILVGQRRNASDDKQLSVWLASTTEANQAWKHAIEIQRPTAQELRGTKEQRGLIRQLLDDYLHVIVPADEHRETVNSGLGKLINATQQDWGSIARLVEFLDMFVEVQSGLEQRHITQRTLDRIVEKLRLIDPTVVQAFQEERTKQRAQNKQVEAAQKLISVLLLDEEQRVVLERVRDSHDKPAIRERAVAILLFAGGKSLAEIAESYSKAKNPETIRGWIKQYRSEGIAGLETKSGQGRKLKKAEKPAVDAIPK